MNSEDALIAQEYKIRYRTLVAYDSRGIKMAKWYERDDWTYDRNNRRISKGNILLDMFFEE